MFTNAFTFGFPQQVQSNSTNAKEFQFGKQQPIGSAPPGFPKRNYTSEFMHHYAALCKEHGETNTKLMLALARALFTNEKKNESVKAVMLTLFDELVKSDSRLKAEVIAEYIRNNDLVKINNKPTECKEVSWASDESLDGSHAEDDNMSVDSPIVDDQLSDDEDVKPKEMKITVAKTCKYTHRDFIIPNSPVTVCNKQAEKDDEYCDGHRKVLESFKSLRLRNEHKSGFEFNSNFARWNMEKNIEYWDNKKRFEDNREWRKKDN